MHRHTVLPLVAALSVCLPHSSTVAAPAATSVAPTIPLTNVVPPDVPDLTPDGLSGFAWQEFVALMWPAKANPTPTPTSSYLRGTPTNDLPDITNLHAGDVTVWETFYHRVELFSYASNTGTAGTLPVILPDPNANPVYDYGPSIAVPTTYEGKPIFNNLDEASEIGIAKMYYTPLAVKADALFAQIAAGGSSVTPALVQQAAAASIQAGLLYEAKGNNAYFNYLASTQLNNVIPRTAAQLQTVQLINNNPTTGPTFLFPDNTIEMKATWRHYDPTADKLDDYHWTYGIYYTLDANGNTVPTVGRLLLVSLHIIQKTKTVPTFVFATFEHVTNETNGFRFTNANPQSTPVGSTANGIGNVVLPRSLPDAGLIKAVRQFPIPDATNTFNTIIQGRLKQAGGIQAVWANYRLIGVQATPANNPDPELVPPQQFFLSNFATETNNTLQFFQGGLGGVNFDVPNRSPDVASLDPNTKKYVAFTSGGCLGCHGAAAQSGGSDFSVIANFYKPFVPEPVTPYPGGTVVTQNPAGFPLPLAPTAPPAPPSGKKKKKAA